MTYADEERSINQILARESLLSYVKMDWPEYDINPHHQLIAEALEDVANGKKRRLMIFVPPRHGKSQLASVYFPAWYLGLNPKKQIIATSYSQTLATDFGYKVREVINNELYEYLFDTQIKTDSRSTRKFQLENGSVYFGVGMGGSITGRGADVLIIDDPVKGREAADSPVIRNRHKQWYASVAKTRLHKGGSIVVISTRWHPDDLSGWILKEHTHENWEVISLPAIADQDQQFTFRHGDTWGRKRGEALWSQYPLEELESLRTTMGLREFVSLYQQRPIPLEGSEINGDWFRRYVSLPEFPLQIVQSWDTGTKDKEYNDPSVCTTWYEDRTGYYLVDVWSGRLKFPDLVKQAKRLYDRYRPSSLLIEDQGSGQSLIQELRSGLIPVYAIPTKGSKVTRLREVSSLIENGFVYLPIQAKWLADYEEELCSFPSYPHDDKVDSTVHALHWFKKRKHSHSQNNDENLGFMMETNRQLDKIFYGDVII